MSCVEKERLKEAGWNGTEQNLDPDPRFDVLRHKESEATKYGESFTKPLLA
jgi:hypothetical protein